MSIQEAVDSTSEKIAKATMSFVQTKIGKAFLALCLVGPLTFIPTVYTAWTAPNIDALRTPTWPLMIIINASVALGLAHNGDWRTRLTMVIWILMMAAIWIATLVR